MQFKVARGIPIVCVPDLQWLLLLDQIVPGLPARSIFCGSCGSLLVVEACCVLFEGLLNDLLYSLDFLIGQSGKFLLAALV